jgi:transposase, IS605 orfB family protein
MKPRKFTIVAQLHKKQNHNLIEYINSCFATYGKAKRETFHVVKHDADLNKSAFNTHLQNKYGILKRTANSIISNAQGTLNALMALKQHEKSQLERKISSLKTMIDKLEIKVADNKTLLRLNDKSVSLATHHNLKRKLVSKKNQLNHKKQKLENLNYQIKYGVYKLCFGTKYLLKRDYNKFIEHRDSQLSFVGAKDETAGNQLLQLSYNHQNNQFDIKLRKDIGGFKDQRGSYVMGKVHFNHHKKELILILNNRNSPLSYKIIKKDGRYYLYCTFEIQRDESSFVTRSSNGVIGLDFNKGFVTLTETNQYGHMVNTDLIRYRFKQGAATQTDLEHVATVVKERALVTGKDVIIENLNFKDTKAKTVSKEEKRYNELLHSLAYRKFVDVMENVCYRNYIWLRKVNPAWTSWIAKQKYCPNMKLNIHTGASFVIARRGQGYTDNI